jgi:hypothetical protein
MPKLFPTSVLLIGFGFPATSPTSFNAWQFCAISVLTASIFNSKLISVSTVLNGTQAPANILSLASANYPTTTLS